MSHRFWHTLLLVPIVAVCLFAQGAQLEITNASLPPAQQGNIYGEVFNANGGVTPYTWRISAGTTPPGVTLKENGIFVGTPQRVGTFGFRVSVTDARNASTRDFNVSVAPANGYDGPAQLPVATVATSLADTPAPGAVIKVAAGGNLQAALDSAQCGDTISLQAGATFTGIFRFPALSCDNQHWIIVRTSAADAALPAEGQRVTPCYAGIASLLGRPRYVCNKPRNVLAKLMAPSAVGPVFFQAGANHYRLMGLEIVRTKGNTAAISLVSVQHGSADHIVLDRSWLHGDTADETRIGVNLSGTTHVGIVNSYFSDFHCTAIIGACLEAHAITGGAGDYPGGAYKIENNFLEASAQAILFGGGPATTTPTDITIRFNHFFKPWQWMKGNTPFQGGQSGLPFVVRHALELKNAVRVLAENNLIENVWGGFGEAGTAILLTPKNQHTLAGANVCPNCEVTDVTIRYTRISHASGGFEISTSLSGGGAGGAPAKAGARFSIHDLVLDDISRKYLGWGGLFLLANSWPSNPLNTITINHITGFPDSTGVMLFLKNPVSYPEMYGFVFTNNIVTTGKYPVWSTGGGGTSCAYADVPLLSLNNCFRTYKFTNNALIAVPSAYPASAWPVGNLFADDMQSIGFVQANSSVGGNYQLRSTSPFKNRGTDGRDLGADIVRLNEALRGVE
jgi:Putative Ig domain